MSWVEDLRNQFPVTGRCVYMDTSYDCGGSLSGREAAYKYYDDWENAAAANERGGPGRKTFFKIADETRQMIGTLLGGADGDQICFTRNTNEGINLILEGFAYEPGDEILIHALDHDAVIMPALGAARMRGVRLNIVKEKKGAHYVSARELIDAVTAHTRIIVTSHVQPATGYRIDLEELGSFCRQRNIFLVVDAIQSLGLQPFRAKEWGVDAVAGAGYKWLGAINSIGFLYISPTLAKKVWPVYVSAGPYMDFEQDGDTWRLVCSDETKARKFENSSLNNPGIYSLHAGVEKLLSIGIDRISAHVDSLAGELIRGLAEQGWNVVTPGCRENRGGIVSVLPPDKNKVFEHFRKYNIALSISHQTYIRFGIAAYSTMDDIRKVLDAASMYPAGQ